MADPTTPFLGLTKPIVNDEAGEDLWGEKLNGNFDKLDASAADIVDDITLLQTTVVTDSPHDGHPYGRKDGAWFDVSTLPVSWTSVTGKPATFPPELPIPQTGVTGLIADQATQNSAITANTTAISTKEPAIAPGTVNDFWRGDKTWVPLSTITVDAYTKAQADARFAPIVHTHAIADVTGLTAALAGKEPSIATGNPAYFWAGDKTWKPVPPAGLTDAPSDGVTYGRKNAAWTAVSGPVTVGLTAPVSPRPGDLWYKSDVCQLYVYYDDGNTQQWVVTTPSQSIDGLDARYVKKAGDTMSGALQVRASNVAASWAGQVIADDVVVVNGIGINAYVNAAGNVWNRINAGFAHAMTYTPNNGTLAWNSAASGAAEATATFGQLMVLDASGNLAVVGSFSANGSVVAASYFTSSTINAVLSATGTGAVSLRPNGAGSTSGQLTVGSNGALTITGNANLPQINFTDSTFAIKSQLYWQSSVVTLSNALTGQVLQLSSTPYLNINGNAQKPGGGPWIDSSDARIKNVLGDYEPGLDEVLALQPRRFTYKGNDTREEPGPGPDTDVHRDAPIEVPYPNSSHYMEARDGKEFVGLIAQEVEAILPGMVSLHPGFIDGEATDIRLIDSTELIFALVNAVKTLAARVAALEAA